MHEKLKASFDRIHAESDLKDSTREFLFRRMYADTKRPVAYGALPAAALCLVFMLVGIGGGGWVYFTPVSAVSIDVNPSIEFRVNRFDRVLSVEGYNDDGAELASAMDLRFMGYMDAIDRVLKDETVADCLARDEVLSIMVSSANGERQKEMLTNVECYAAGYRNVYCSAGRYEDVSAAHAHHLSFGKYQAFIELQTLDPDITPEDMQDWTMREIRDRIDALSETASDSGRGPGHHGQGGGYGHRNGWGSSSE